MSSPYLGLLTLPYRNLKRIVSNRGPSVLVDALCAALSTKINEVKDKTNGPVGHLATKKAVVSSLERLK